MIKHKTFKLFEELREFLGDLSKIKIIMLQNISYGRGNSYYELIYVEV